MKQQQRKTLMQYIYDARGNAVGFIRNKYIHAMNGNAIGQLNGSHVHKLSGNYVGELYKDMIVDMNYGNFGNIGNPGNPGNRGSINYGYKDVFSQLL
jgi:hypothetical protein